MKGNDLVIACLNGLLADELTAVNQYMVHAAMCANWGYEKLHDKIEHRAIDEMKHAERLIDRILFLEGTPVVSKYNKLSIGPSVEKQLSNDMMLKTAPSKATTPASAWRLSRLIMARANYLSRSSRTRKPTSTGWKPKWTRSTRWGCRCTWANRSARDLLLASASPWVLG
jgi:bacterioferritin